MSTCTVILLSLLLSPPLHSQEPPLPPVHVSGGVMAGRIMTKAEPVLPPIQPGEHVAGATVLHAIIGKDGHVESLSVISGPEVLRGPVMETVRQWTYKPYLINGEPVEVETTITINISFGGPPSQSAEAAPQAPVRVSGGVMAGTLLTRVFPKLPQEAIDAHVNGAVVLHVVIGKDGHIKNITPISGPEMLRAAYMDAVRQWTYKPYLLNGKPVEVDTTITLSMQFGGK